MNGTKDFFASHFKSKSFQILALSLFVFTVLISVFTSFTKREIPVNAPVCEYVSYLEERIPQLMDDYGIAGTTIALVKEGETVWTNAYGSANLEEGRKMTPETYCRVESISKSVTAWGVLKLVEERKVTLDNPLGDYLKSWKIPESPFSEEKITIRQLLSQTSGMPLGTIGVRYAPNSKTPSLKEHLSKDAVLFQEPNTSFSYSNTGFNLLELLIEEVTGQNFASYMKKEVLLPLGMNHSTFEWSDTFVPPVPLGYDLKGSPVPVYVYPDKASGGLFATVEDVALFIAAGMSDFNSVGEKVLAPRYIDSLYTEKAKLSGYYSVVFDSYGFGHFIEKLPKGMKSVSHGGQGSGWMTHFQSVPETGDGIVILTNSQRSWPFFGHILTDWAEWNGFGSVGMGKIVWARNILWAFIGVLFIFVIFHLWKLINCFTAGERQFDPLSNQSWLPRLVNFVLFLLLMAGISWMLALEYFFLFSVFPIATNWLVGTGFFVALVLLVLSLFPKVQNKSFINRK